MAAKMKQTVCVFAAFVVQLVLAGVYELDESFLEIRGTEPWLVEFYAPWCGHCRKLEPIYHSVWIQLRHTSIRVSKIDATRYANIASEFDVRGYPTIKFIHKDKVYTHRGERTKEALVEFAKRARGPQVRHLPNLGKFNDARSDLSEKVFFLYVGPQDAFEDLYTKYTSVAEKYAVYSWYFAGEKKILPKEIKITREPTVLVFKDGKYFEYIPSEDETKSSLDDWMNGERYPAYPKLGGGALNEMSEMKKMIVMVVIDEKDEQNPHQKRFKDMGENIASMRRPDFHKAFQFLWMTDLDTVNSITMGHLETPVIIILDPETQYYYQPSHDAHNMTQPELQEFLQQILEGQSPAYGGTGILQRFKRVIYDLYMTVYSVYETSGWLALTVFGIPAFVVFIICYALCCMEPFDDSIFDREPEGEEEEGRAAAVDDAEKQPLLPGETAPATTEDDGHMKKE